MDKEALALVFAVIKFHKYLYGRPFSLLTDHKPLVYLFNENKSIPSQASARVQRWALMLAAYRYTIKHRPGREQGNVDALSRLPLAETPNHVPCPGEVLLLSDMLDRSPISAKQIKHWISLLSKVRHYVQFGWPDFWSGTADNPLSPYWRRRNELSVEDGCILWGSRIVIPPAGQVPILHELHDTHPGISRMKSLARSYMWWPNMDQCLENEVKTCDVCQSHRDLPVASPLHPWQWPSGPWSRIHVDYAGPFLGKMFLIIIDAYSKWLEIHMMSSSTSEATVQKLRETFAVFGLPKTVVTDNGPCFTSSEFEQFLLKNGIAHKTSPPYHPASNGLAERAVQTFKKAMLKMSESLPTRLSRFLFRYRITPQSTTGRSPAELMFGRPLRSRLDLLFPDIQHRVVSQQEKQKAHHDQHCRHRQFNNGDHVYARNFTAGPAWIPGTINMESGNTAFEVQLEDG